MFEAVLHEIQVRWQNWNACKAFLFEVLAQPLPAPGGRIEISTVSWREPGAIDNLVFTRPSATDALFDYVNFEPMLRECDATCIVTLFSSLLVERRVVFTSDSLEALSAVVNAALALLRPLQWQYIFIPLLPRSMVGFCSSPIPFVVGLLNSSLEALRKEPHESLVLLDIDNGEFLTETPDADLIPAAEREKLLNAVKLAQQKLKRNKHLTQGDARALCDIFVAFFTVQLSGWRAHYRDNRLEIDEFVAQRADPRAKRLLTSMCSSQMFTQFAAMYSATDDAVACNSADGFVSALEQANNEVHDHAKPSRRAQLWRLRRLERGGTDGPPLAAGHHADDEPEEIVFKQGWLNKLSGKRKGKWERRWFKLTANKLVWYKTRTDAKESGSVFLPDVTYITDRYKGHVGKENCMELVTRERTHYIYADSTAELGEWYPHIQMLCVSSTTFQEPDERSALALASSLSLVPTEYVDSANSSSGTASPLRTLSSEATAGNAVRSKLASFLSRRRDAPQKTNSTPPMPPPNPYARGRATSATTTTTATTATTATATATTAPASPTNVPATTTSSQPQAQQLTSTIATATALMAAHRLAAFHKPTPPSSSSAAPLPTELTRSQSQPTRQVPNEAPARLESPSLTSVNSKSTTTTAPLTIGRNDNDADDDDSDLTYSHTESTDTESGDSGSDEPLPKLPSATLAASAKMRASPLRLPPVPNAPPPNKLERSRSNQRSASVNYEPTFTHPADGRRDSSPPPSPSGLNPTAAAVAATSSPLSSSPSSPQPPYRRPPPVPATQPPPVMRKSATPAPSFAASPPSPLSASPAASGSPTQ